MIRLNLMRNQFGSTSSMHVAPSHLDLEFDSQENFGVRGKRKPFWFALAAVLAAAAGFASWHFLKSPDGDEASMAAVADSTAAAVHDSALTDAPAPLQDSVAPVAATTTEAEVPKPAVDPAVAKAATAESLRVAKASEAEQKIASAKAKKDSIAAVAAHKADSVRMAKSRREDSIAQAKVRRADSISQAKSRMERERAAVQQAATIPEKAREPMGAGYAPAVTAPPLAGGVLDFVLGEARSSTSGSTGLSASRFEDLPPAGRMAYQRFAFEQILNKLRQVTPANGVGYSRVRIYSPGILVVEGEAQSSETLSQLLMGLAAQSMVDTSSRIGNDGLFQLTARLPFSASASASAALSGAFSDDIVRAVDLAAAQGMELAKPGAARMSQTRPFPRASWRLSGTGSWDGCTKWIASLGGVGSPIGFTSLELVSGPDGKLKVVASTIAYGK